MKNFTFQNPTKLIFGKGRIARLSSLIPQGKRIMITFGGGSVKNNGVYDQVVEALKGRDYIEFWGIEPNPSVEHLRKGALLGKERGVDFLLAVGGGSVLDATKLLARAILYDGDPWELVINEEMTPYLPIGAVMTLPATGSEMNGNAVISRYETKEKFGFFGVYPQFSILDPQTTYSLPDYQIACGIADTFIHTCEQYMTWSGQSPLMDRWAEGIFSTLVEIAPKVKANKQDYDTMADFMLCATMALNGFIGMGVVEDWTTHMIGHELTALSGITHGHTLAILYPGVLTIMQDDKRSKILQYAERVWGITEGSEDQRIDAAIQNTDKFFRSLGLKTRLSEMNVGMDIVDEIVGRFAAREEILGERENIDSSVVRKILENRLI